MSVGTLSLKISFHSHTKMMELQQPPTSSSSSSSSSSSRLVTPPTTTTLRNYQHAAIEKGKSQSLIVVLPTGQYIYKSILTTCKINEPYMKDYIPQVTYPY